MVHILPLLRSGPQTGRTFCCGQRDEPPKRGRCPRATKILIDNEINALRGAKIPLPASNFIRQFRREYPAFRRYPAGVRTLRGCRYYTRRFGDNDELRTSRHKRPELYAYSDPNHNAATCAPYSGSNNHTPIVLVQGIARHRLRLLLVFTPLLDLEGVGPSIYTIACIAIRRRTILNY